MTATFEKLTSLRAEWQALQPVKTEHNARLWKKLRLEWNYHSNHIEGNTLTYGETELLLLHDRTTGHHSHREYLEMKAHDAGIEYVRTLSVEPGRVLSETDIRDLNKIILKEPFWKAAETSDGQPTRKEIIPGQYKTTPNNVRTASGDTFFFASVEDTPPRMQALAGWLRQELENPTLHPIALAAQLHHDLVLIHPFDDGNGRVARLLVNYILMRSGYLPVIVRSEDKAGYLTALRLADAGDLNPLTEYLARLAEWSLRLGIKAGKGEAVEELSDVEKEVSIFIREQNVHEGRVKMLSPDVVRELYELGLKALIQKVGEKLLQLSPLFLKHTVSVSPGIQGYRSNACAAFEAIIPDIERFKEFTINYCWEGYRGRSPEPFNWNIDLALIFDPFQYRIERQHLAAVTPIAKKLYSELLLAEESDRIATDILSWAFEDIKRKSGA